MSTAEFKNEFDILYNNISSNAAPGLDLYEISVYLTKAQLEIVKEYNGSLNKYQKGFDGSDKRRIDLKELIRDYKSTNAIVSNNRLTSELQSKFFEIPSDVFLIKYESGLYTKHGCSIEIDIIPITLDDVNKSKKNPFKQPDKDLAWRVDYNSITSNTVEIISTELITMYHLRYLKYPDPIILTNLSTNEEFSGMNLSIGGIFIEQTCKLNQELHNEILDRAVELATRDYKENTLQNKVQLNNRNN